MSASLPSVQGLELDEGPLKAFLDESKDLEPADKGVKLSENEAMIAAHNEAAADGQSNQVDGEAGHHMVCFVAVDGKLYVRISAHIYNDLSEYETLAKAIHSM